MIPATRISTGVTTPSLSVSIRLNLPPSFVRLLALGRCGALRFHMNDQEGGLDDMRRNIDAWWPLVEGLTSAGTVEAIVMNASGCGVTVKEYGHSLARDPHYANKAGRISDLTRDLSELLPDLVEVLREVVAALKRFLTDAAKWAELIGRGLITNVTDMAITSRIATTPAGLNTVILTDSSKVDLEGTLIGSPGGTLRKKLDALAARAADVAEVAGVDRCAGARGFDVQVQP